MDAKVTKVPRKGQFQLGDPRAGRPKGVPNKTTQAAKEAFALAFKGLGGVKALMDWAQENTTEFYKLYARLIPVEQHVSNPDGLPVIRVEFVRPDER